MSPPLPVNPRRAKLAALEAHAGRDPDGYRRRLLAIGLLGYGSIALFVAALLGVVGFLGWRAATVGLTDAELVLFVLSIAFGGLVGRSLWVRQERPSGVPLDRSDAPKLFEWLDELGPRLKAPPIHRVYLDHEFNAHVMQRGLRNELSVGLPLLCILTPQQMKGVLAHELGHLSRGDGRLSSWVYYQRLRWERLRAELVDPPGAWLMWPFARFYLPWFDLWSFVQARAQERIADRGEVEVVGGETAARTHAHLALITAWYVHRFIPDFIEGALRAGGPLTDLARRTLGALGEPVPPSRLRWWLREALRVPTGDEDTHPGLAERIEAAAPGFLPEVTAFVPEQTAAELLLADFDALVARLDAAPDPDMVGLWERHQARARERSRDRTGRGGGIWSELTAARERDALDGPEGALRLWRRLANRRESLAPAWDGYGRALLSAGEEAEGLEAIEKAMALDPEMAPDPAMAVADHFRAQDRPEDAEAWERRAADAAALTWPEPLDERCAPAPPDLPGYVRKAILERVDALPEVAGAWLVGLQPPEGHRAHLLALRLRFRGFLHAEEVWEKLDGWLAEVWIPGRFELVDLDEPDWRWLRGPANDVGERLR